jgi:CRP-like cAMP-binding protein
LNGGIFTTMGMILTNLIGMATLTLRRFRISLPAAHTDIYLMFSMLSPGDFRLVMKHADRAILELEQTVTTEGDPVKCLYFILSGNAEVSKRGAQFALPDRVFIGEVAYLLQRPGVATTTISAGAEVLRWDVDDMRQNIARNPRFKLAIDAMLSYDPARKIGEAVAPQMQPQVA